MFQMKEQDKNSEKITKRMEKSNNSDQVFKVMVTGHLGSSVA